MYTQSTHLYLLRPPLTLPIILLNLPPLPRTLLMNGPDMLPHLILATSEAPTLTPPTTGRPLAPHAPIDSAEILHFLRRVRVFVVPAEIRLTTECQIRAGRIGAAEFACRGDVPDYRVGWRGGRDSGGAAAFSGGGEEGR